MFYYPRALQCDLCSGITNIPSSCNVTCDEIQTAFQKHHVLKGIICFQFMSPQIEDVRLIIDDSSLSHVR